MFKFFVVFSSLVAMSSAYAGYGYGGYGGYGGGHAVPAAVLSHHEVTYHDVHNQGHIKPTTIDVPANILPINFIFRSASSLVNVESKHEGAKGSFKETHSQDEPHQLIHTVNKPIYQEVREIVSPFRRIVQTVEPVREDIQTVVARGTGQAAGLIAGADGAGLAAGLGAGAALGNLGGLGLGDLGCNGLGGGAGCGLGPKALAPIETLKKY